MSNPWFAFKQFTVWQDKTPMKITTDGVLLGAWVGLKGQEETILDVGTGTGLIALMLAQRGGKNIDAIEINKQAAIQAGENVNRSPWKDRVQVFHDSFQEFVTSSTRRYDLIVCNPPYFNGALKPSDPGKCQARHSEGLQPGALIEGAAAILKPEGRLALILPAGNAPEFVQLAGRSELWPQRQCMVIPVPGKPPERALMEFSTLTSERKVEELLIREKEYTPAYRRLTAEFYLNF